MGVKLVASSGGSVELVPTNTASNFTVTVPAKTGTMAMDGPAFSAYKSADQTVTSTVLTKVTYDTEVFDTNSNFASSTFTPTVAGYYQVNVTFAGQTTSTLTYLQGRIYKNGTTYKLVVAQSTSDNTYRTASDLIYMNGTTDYLEIYCRLDGAGTISFVSGSTTSSFSASMVRGA